MYLLVFTVSFFVLKYSDHYSIKEFKTYAFLLKNRYFFLLWSPCVHSRKEKTGKLTNFTVKFKERENREINKFSASYERYILRQLLWNVVIISFSSWQISKAPVFSPNFRNYLNSFQFFTTEVKHHRNCSK